MLLAYTGYCADKTTVLWAGSTYLKRKELTQAVTAIAPAVNPRSANTGTNQLVNSPAKIRSKCYLQLLELKNLVESGSL